MSKNESVGSFDSKAYFQTREGLCVWDGFAERILSATQPIDDPAKMAIGSVDLVKSAGDELFSGFRKERRLWRGPYTDASAFCFILAKAIDQQPNGEVGDDLRNDDWNNFTVDGKNEAHGRDKLHGVVVGWHSDNQEWIVGAHSLHQGPEPSAHPRVPGDFS